MTISGSSGTLLWSKVVANQAPYKIAVVCSNIYGSNSMTFTLTVRPSYKAVLDALPPGPFIQPRPMLISGKVQWISNESKIYLHDQVPVNIL